MKVIQRHRLGRFAASSLTLLLGGCALWPQFGAPPFVGPPKSPLLTAEQSPTDQARDTSGVAPFPGEYGQANFQLLFLPRFPTEATPAASPVRRRAQPSSSPAAAVIDTAMGDSARAALVPARVAADSLLSAPKPPVTVAPRGEGAGERAVRTDLDEAARLLRGFDSSRLIRSDKEKLRTIYSLISQAEDNLRRRDVAPAAGLARKARLLAEELASQ